MSETRVPQAGGASDSVGDPALMGVIGGAIMALGSDVVFVLDASTLQVVQVNRAFERVFGYRRGEAAALGLRDLADAAFIAQALAAASESDLGAQPFRRKGGGLFDLETRALGTEVGGRRYHCVVGCDLTDRQAAERARAESELRLRTFVDASFEGLAITDQGRVVDVNARLPELLGAPSSSLVGRSVIDFIAPESRSRVVPRLQSGDPQAYEHLCLRIDGTKFPVEVQAKTIQLGERSLRVTAIRDISERKNLEEQVRQAQRMESIGRLAGGVAHDFNNLLTVILSLVRLLTRVPRSAADRDDLEQIQTAAERAAELTQQLLAFARRQIVEPQSLDLNELVTRIDKMLRRLIGEDIRLTTIPDPGIGRIRADPGKVEQVLMNLAVNARDAMENGGKLTIETANVELGEDYAANHPEVHPGRYVMLSVSDTGAGMDAVTMAHIFEPFFTTKSAGKGTGLGLATCYGIVKQSGGSIWVYSEAGKGTTFKVYFPQFAEETVPVPPPVMQAAPFGSETLLVVEDDDMVRRVAVRILRDQGYVVHDTGDPVEALAVFERLGGAIDLLVTDVVMAGMSGKELANQLRARRPALKVLYTSGYTENTIVHHGVVDVGVNFLEKPYVPDELARRVREVLDRLG